MKVKGRTGPPIADFTLTFRKEDEECVIRFDDANNPSFWLEFTISLAQLQSLCKIDATIQVKDERQWRQSLKNPCSEIIINDELMMAPAIDGQPTGRSLEAMKVEILSNYLRPGESQQDCIDRVCKAMSAYQSDYTEE